MAGTGPAKQENSNCCHAVFGELLTDDLGSLHYRSEALAGVLSVSLITAARPTAALARKKEIRAATRAVADFSRIEG